nr:hypothetical protein [Tanacetum cinerariifolium]
MLRIEIFQDVVGISGYHYGVLRSFLVKRIKQGIGWSSDSIILRKSLRCWFGSSDQNPWIASVLHQPDGVGSKRYHVVPYRELDGILVALVARFGVLSKSADRILVSHGG